MNKAFLIILFLSTSITITYSQMNCHIKLFDSYSSNQIQLNNSIQIKNADFSIDTINNLIMIDRIKRKRLEIKFGEYELYYEKLNLRKFKNDTLSRQLTPIKSVLIDRYEQIWSSDDFNSDTLIFENTYDIKKHITSYFKYLIYHLNMLDTHCGNGLCSYGNTYRYNILFSKKGSTYEIERIDKLQPHGYNCVELENHIEKLRLIYPKFKIRDFDENTDKMSISFTVRMN